MPSSRLIRLRFILALALLCLLAGCRAPSAAAVVQIPTLAVLPSQFPLENAERIAREFLQNWQDNNTQRMFELVSFGSQEATPQDSFLDLYQVTAITMGLTDIAVTATGIYRESESVAALTYNVTFDTETFGAISEENRILHLVVDTRAQDWRVAWTAADLFPELASGGRLQLRSTPPNRANIYDRDGVILADQEGRVAMIGIVRQEAPDWTNCLNTLSAALSLPVEDVQTRLESRPASELVEIGMIDQATYDTVSQQLDAFCDARLEGRRVRRYANGTLMPAILGYVGYPSEEEIPSLELAGFNQDSLIGRTGVELAWDETLRGIPETSLEIVSPSGQVLRELGGHDAQPGRSLWLTIDSDLQAAVARIIADAYTQAKDTWAAGSPGASAVVMDVNTGAILAMVSYPTFDNNAYNAFPTMGRPAAAELIADYQSDPSNPEVNRPAQGLYTLGSVMKTITATAAADSGVYALDEPYMCSDNWDRDIPRTDWLAGGHGALTLSSALTQSCNPYFYEAGYNLYMADPYILPDYAHRLGFGEPTGMTDIPEEIGFMPDPDWFRTSFGFEMPFSEEVNMAVGQGYVQVTPLQVTRWISAIANGGTLYAPYLVGYTGMLGEAQQPAHTPVAEETGIRPEVMDMLHSGMCAVTTASSGTAEFVFRNSPVQSIGVCGKTGTAQTGGPTTPSHAWFASYAPRDNPEIAVVVLVETAGQGSEIAAPIARQIYEYYFGFTE